METCNGNWACVALSRENYQHVGSRYLVHYGFYGTWTRRKSDIGNIWLL